MEKRIGFGPRFGAIIIDAVIVWVMILVIHLVLGRMRWMSGVLSAVAILAYFFTEVMNSASPGKMILGLVIGTADGAPAPQDLLLKRYIIKQAGNLIGFVASLIPFLGIVIGFLGGLVG